MTSPESSSDWQDVETLADFVAYLYLLAADADRLERGDVRWHPTTVPGFLAAIDALLAFDQPVIAGWRDLAELLHNATTEERTSADTPEHPAVVVSENVDSREALRAYLHWLIEDFRLDAADVAERSSRNKWDNEGRWAHPNLSGWLGTWGGWLEDSYLQSLPAPWVREAPERDRVEPVSWRSVAIQLFAARIYE